MYDFVVAGKYPFPLDMLRYDSCWPADSSAVQAISDSLTREAACPPEGYRVRLRSAVSRELTAGRWSSFLWTVCKE